MNNTNPSQSQTDTTSATSKPSEFWTVFLLSLLLGVFGAHRFYARKFKSGIFQLLTCGGLGIWSFIDVIVILLSKFRSSTGVLYQNPKPKVAWGVFAAVCILGFISAASDKQSGGGGSGGGSHSTSSGNSTTRKLSGVYQCANPAWTLQLRSDGTFAMQALDSGDSWHGTWSADGASGTLEPTSAASMSFTIEGDGAIVIDKYGYMFVR